jgi:shikimate dehydrogenase
MQKNSKKTAVIGDPINHSISPTIHNHWLSKYQIDSSYQAINVKAENLEEFIKKLSKENFIGINITIPHKETAYEIIKKIGRLSNIAQKIKAINTIKILDDDSLYGDNTDAYGFVASIKEQLGEDYSLQGKKALLIGAGGAARALAFALDSEQIDKLTIMNRNLEKAKDLANEVQISTDYKRLVDLKELELQYDLIINSTSLGLNNENNLEVDFNKITTKAVIYDIVYKPILTKLLKDAKANDNETINGLPMLIHQAAKSFELWFGILPEIDKDLLEKVT